MAKQIAVRIPDELEEELKTLVKDGEFVTSAEAVRVAVRELAERKRQERLDRAIVEGYRRQPPTSDEEAWAKRASEELIAEEPW